jgi:hypothetical protein
MKSLALFLLALAGCGGDQSMCGATGQPCCAPNNACNQGNACVSGTCTLPPTCGTIGNPCCINSTCTDATAVCTNGTCTKVVCGDVGQACCDAINCNGNLGCLAGLCTDMGKTGDPCKKNTDCLGTKPTCLLTDSRGIVWPDGYCTSTCSEKNNDPMTTLNTTCPGGVGSCQGKGNTGQCELACTSMTGGAPCTRTGYSCFSETTNVCEPNTRSHCDPTMKLSCPQDGGALIFIPADGAVDDAGTFVHTYRSCAQIGVDAVGECVDGCDPLYPQKAGAPSPPCFATQACYPNNNTGDGECFLVINGGLNEGDVCQFKNECNAGLSCHDENMVGHCRQLCGGPGNIGCPNGQTCMDISATVKAAVVGICGK